MLQKIESNRLHIQYSMCPFKPSFSTNPRSNCMYGTCITTSRIIGFLGPARHPTVWGALPTQLELDFSPFKLMNDACELAITPSRRWSLPSLANTIIISRTCLCPCFEFVIDVVATITNSTTKGYGIYHTEIVRCVNFSNNLSHSTTWVVLFT